MTTPLESAQLACDLARLTASERVRANVRHLARDADWSEVLRFASKHRIAQLLHYSLTNSFLDIEVPEPVRRTLKDTFELVTIRNAFRRDALHEMLERLAGDGIQPLLFKGCLLLQTVYPHLGLRPMCDIDLLIREEDVSVIRRVLSELGYDCRDVASNLTHELCYSSSRTSVEPHFHFSRPGRYLIDEEGIRARARHYAPGVWGLDPTDHLLILAMHNASCYVKRPALYYLDMAELIVQSPVDWCAVRERAVAWKLRTATSVTLHQMQRFFETDVPQDVELALRPAWIKSRYLETMLQLYPPGGYDAHPTLWRLLLGLPLLDGMLTPLRQSAAFTLSMISPKTSARAA